MRKRDVPIVRAETAGEMWADAIDRLARMGGLTSSHQLTIEQPEHGPESSFTLRIDSTVVVRVPIGRFGSDDTLVSVVREMAKTVGDRHERRLADRRDAHFAQAGQMIAGRCATPLPTHPPSKSLGTRPSPERDT